MKRFDMNHRHFLAAGLPAASAVSFGQRSTWAPGGNAISPKHRYLSDASALSAAEAVNGPARVLDLKGRKGINPTSIHTAIKLASGHTINQPKGTTSLMDSVCS